MPKSNSPATTPSPFLSEFYPQRVQTREAGWDQKQMKTKEEFDFRDEKELGWGLGSAVAMADYVIVNDGTLDEFKDNVEKLFRKLL